MFDKKNDAARNKKRADAIVYAGAAGEVVLTQNDFESEAEFRRWKTWSDEDYKRTEKVMRKDYDHAIYGLEGEEIPAPEEEQTREVCIDEKKLRAILTERQFERLTLYAIRGMTVEQIAEQEGVAHQNVSKSIRQAKKKIKFFFESFNRFLIISLDVLICRYSPLLRAFPALFISEEPHKSFYYPSCFRSQK